MKISNKIFTKIVFFMLLLGLAACGIDDKEKEVSPPEDLMQEHGILERILLIYEDCEKRLNNHDPFPNKILAEAATTLRSFIEEYHEKQEEEFMFPVFIKAAQNTELVNTLLEQHRAGRKITGRIIEIAGLSPVFENGNPELAELLDSFIKMYRPHAARENTVLFPAFREITSKYQYEEVGEKFEENEHRLFGKNGFETVVKKVAELEKALQIYDLSKFTPSIK